MIDLAFYIADYGNVKPSKNALDVAAIVVIDSQL